MSINDPSKYTRTQFTRRFQPTKVFDPRLEKGFGQIPIRVPPAFGLPLSDNGADRRFDLYALLPDHEDGGDGGGGSGGDTDTDTGPTSSDTTSGGGTSAASSVASSDSDTTETPTSATGTAMTTTTEDGSDTTGGTDTFSCEIPTLCDNPIFCTPSGCSDACLSVLVAYTNGVAAFDLAVLCACAKDTRCYDDGNSLDLCPVCTDCTNPPPDFPGSVCCQNNSEPLHCCPIVSYCCYDNGDVRTGTSYCCSCATA